VGGAVTVSDMDREGVAEPAFIRVGDVDPLMFSCAVCGWTPEDSGRANDQMFWPVIKHWLAEHWAGAQSGASDENNQ
jgi:hypothetical protein